MSGPVAAVLVLGMHRSGTSAVTRVLNLLGFDLGDTLKEAAADNPNGFWEHSDALAIHERLLQKLERTWDDPRPLPDAWQRLPAARSAVDEIAHLVEREFLGRRAWAVKDPRLCRFVPLWREALAKHDIEPRALVVVRNPSEVAQSLEERDQIPQAVGSCLWARYMQEAEAGSRGLRRSLIAYESLLDDYRSAFRRVASELDVQLDVSPDSHAAIEAFLIDGLRHHRSPGPAQGLAAAMAEAALAHAPSDSALERIAEQAAALDCARETYGPVLDGLVAMLQSERGRFQRLQHDLEQTADALRASTAWGESRNLELQETVAQVNALREELARSTAWGTSRNLELEETVAQVNALRDELARSTAWGASRDAELAATVQQVEALRSELGQAAEDAEDLQRELQRSEAQRVRDVEAVEAEVRRSQQRADAMLAVLSQRDVEIGEVRRHAALIGARVLALEHEVRDSGGGGALRRAAEQWGEALAGAAERTLDWIVLHWPGSEASKLQRENALARWKEVRLSGVNSAAILADVDALAADRWPARPAYCLKKCARDASADVDVSLVVHHSERWVEGFLSALHAIDYPLERLHLYVRDHGGNDATRMEFERCMAQHGARLGSFTYSAGRNAGFGAGHNHNFALGRSALFFVCNVDGRLRPDALRLLVGASAASKPDVAAWEMRQAPYEHPKYYDPVTMLTSWITGACVMFDRERYAKVGGFDERIFMYGEDVDLSYRLRGRGYSLAYVPAAVFEHDTYSEPSQFKALQFHGSSLANVLLRLRFGSLADVLAIPGMWGELGRSAKQNGVHRGHLRTTLRLLRHAPAFLLTRRRRGAVRVPFARWDYGLRREGAFEVSAARRDDFPLVTIVVRTYRGRADLLRQALASVANQTYPAIEVIVVEDKGAEMKAVAEDAARDFGLSLVYLSCTGPESNRCVTGNIGLSKARGTYANFLDDDDLLFADHVEYLASRLDAAPDMGACYAFAWEAKIETDPATGRYMEVLHSSHTSLQIPFDRELLQTRNYMPIQTVLFRTELFREYGGFNVRLDNLEDWELWRRFSLRHDFQMCPKTTSLYHVPAAVDMGATRQAKLDAYYTLACVEFEAARIELDRRHAESARRLTEDMEQT